MTTTLADHQRRFTDAVSKCPGEKLSCSVIDSSLLQFDGFPASATGHLQESLDERAGWSCRATEDCEDDSDSTTSKSTLSTSDELAAELQNLHLRVGDAEQVTEPLVARGPPGATATDWTNNYQSSMQLSLPTSFHTDQNTVIDTNRCKRKIFEFPEINMQPVPVACTYLEAFQPEPSWKDWTGWCSQQQNPLATATKFRRSGDDPQENDEHASATSDSSLTSALTSGILGCFDSSPGTGGFGFVFDLDTECDFAKYYPEMVPKPLSSINDHGNAPPALQYDTDEWKTLGCGSFLDQLTELAPALDNPSVDPNPEMTTAVMGGSYIITGPSTQTSLADLSHCSFTAMNELPWSGWSPSGSASALSSSTDSGFVDVSGSGSPRSSTDDLHHQLPSDVIFEYVEDKLRELDEQETSKNVEHSEMKLEQSTSSSSVTSHTLSLVHQQPASHVVQARDKVFNGITGAVNVEDEVSVERRRMTKASRNIAQLTRDQLMTIDNNGDTVLHVALRKSSYLSEALIHRLDREQLTACLINQRNAFSSETPLWLATLTNKPRLVELLVERGAEMNSQVYESRRQQTGPFCPAIHLASSHGLPYLSTLSQLLNSPSLDLTVVDSQGRTAIHRAVEAHGQPTETSATDLQEVKDSTDIIRLLVMHGADINQPDLLHHKTAMQWAVERVACLGSVDLVRQLLQVTSTPASSSSTPRTTGGTRHRPDTIEHLLNVAYKLPTNNDELRRRLVQLLTDTDHHRRCSAVVHW